MKLLPSIGAVQIHVFFLLVCLKQFPKCRGHPGLAVPLQHSPVSAGCSRQTRRQKVMESMLPPCVKSRKHLSPYLSIDFLLLCQSSLTFSNRC